MEYTERNRSCKTEYQWRENKNFNVLIIAYVYLFMYRLFTRCGFRGLSDSSIIVAKVYIIIIRGFINLETNYISIRTRVSVI